MKKFVAILLVLVMALGMVGCSKAEVGYVEMLKEVNTMGPSTFEQTMAMTIDPELLEDTGLEFLGDYVELEMKGSQDLDKMAMDMTIRYRLNKTDEFAPLTRLVKIDNNFMASTQDIFTALVKHNDQLKWPPEFVKDMKAYLAKNPYVSLDMTDSYTGMEAEVEAYTKALTQENNEFFDALVKNHSQYTTGVISEKDGVYITTLNQKNLIAMIDTWLAYAKNNPAASYEMYNHANDYLEGELEMELENQAEWSAFLVQAGKEWNSLKSELAELGIGAKDSLTTYEKLTGAPGARVYTSKATLNLEEIGFNMVFTSTITEGTINIKKPGTMPGLEMFIEDVFDIVDEYSTYHNTTIDLVTEDVTVNTSFEAITIEDYVDLVNVNNSNYISVEDLDNIIMDGDIVWDSSTNQVLLETYHGETMAIGHIMVNGLPHAKIADLANVGYTVEVVKTPSLSIVITPYA